MKGWHRRSKFATLIKKQRKQKQKEISESFCMWERKLFLSETENQRPKNMRKHIDKIKIKMKGWQRKSKFETLIKRTENNKFKKTFAC